MISTLVTIVISNILKALQPAAVAAMSVTWYIPPVVGEPVRSTLNVSWLTSSCKPGGRFKLLHINSLLSAVEPVARSTFTMSPAVNCILFIVLTSGEGVTNIVITSLATKGTVLESVISTSISQVPYSEVVPVKVLSEFKVIPIGNVEVVVKV